MKMNQLINENQMSFDDADKQTRNDIDLEVKNMVESMQAYALNSESSWKLFVGRDLEATSIVGGIKRIENSLQPGESYFNGTNIKIEKINIDDISEDIKQVDKTLDELIDKAEKYKDDNDRETRKFMEHNKHKPIWNKTIEGMKTQMMIGFVILKTKDGKEKKMIFASGNEPLYSKQLTDDKQTREKLRLEKTKKGFEFINTGFEDKNLRIMEIELNQTRMENHLPNHVIIV